MRDGNMALGAVLLLLSGLHEVGDSCCKPKLKSGGYQLLG